MRIEYFVEFGERSNHTGKVRSGIEKFESERENFIFNTFIYSKPVKRLKNRSGVSEYWSFNNGTSKGVLDLLETMYLRLMKIVVQRVTVIKFGMYDGDCNDTGCFGIKVRTDAAKLTNVRIAGLDSAEIWSENVRCSSNMKPRLRAE